MKPLKEQTLAEYCQNPNGTYDGVKVMQWLFSAVTGGKELSREEILKEFEDAKARRAKRFSV